MDVNSNPEMQSNQEIQNDELNYGQREVETASPNQEIQNDESNDEQREKETASPNQEILNGALNDGQREDKTDTSARAQDQDSYSNINRGNENLDANPSNNENQEPAQQLYTSKLSCPCKAFMVDIDPDSTYEPCTHQGCNLQSPKKQDIAYTTKFPHQVHSQYPSKFTRKVLINRQLSSSSTHISSTDKNELNKKDTSTSESALDEYPIHLHLRMVEAAMESESTENFTQEQDLWAQYETTRTMQHETDFEEYYSCDSESSEEENYNKTLKPNETSKACLTNQMSTRNMHILKLLQEITNLIQHGNNTKDEVVCIADTCPLFKTVSDVQLCTPVSSYTRTTEPTDIQNASCVCVAVDQEEPICLGQINDQIKLSYKSFPCEPISNVRKDNDDERLACICLKQTGICPLHEDNTEQSIKSNEKMIDEYSECVCQLEECECEENILENTEDLQMICTCATEQDLCAVHKTRETSHQLYYIISGRQPLKYKCVKIDKCGRQQICDLYEVFKDFGLPYRKEKQKMQKEDDTCAGFEESWMDELPCKKENRIIQEPHDPCANSTEFEMYALPENERENQPPIWGSKEPPKDVYDPCTNALDYEMTALTEPPICESISNMEGGQVITNLEEDVFFDLSSHSSDNVMDEKEEDESKLYYEEEEIKGESEDTLEEIKSEAQDALEEIKTQSEEVLEDDKTESEEILDEETEKDANDSKDIVNEQMCSSSYILCSEDELYKIECEEFDEECELLKEVISERHKKCSHKDCTEPKGSKDKLCNCCHCQAERRGKTECTTVATLQEPPCPVDDEMKFFIDSLIFDLEAMEYSRRKYQTHMNVCMPKLTICSRDSFPVTIKSVIELGNTSLYVKWKIHDACSIAGYEIYVDGYLTNRYYNSQHEAAVITDVDVTVPHKIALVAQPFTYDESLNEFCKELKTSTIRLKKKEKSLPPQLSKLSALWVPSIYMYDPNNCKEPPPVTQPIL